MERKLGKLPADNWRDGHPRMEHYVDLGAVMPKIPGRFGDSAAVELIEANGGWGMNGNDRYGDCAWAMAGHLVRYSAATQGRNVPIGTESTLSDYADCTGWNPSDPNSDQGTQLSDLVRYMLTTGILDDTGARHRITHYMRLRPGDLQQLYAALYLFPGGVFVGIEFADYLEDEFNQGKPWTYRTPYTPVGGHAIAVYGREGLPECVTWGRREVFYGDFYTKASDEAWVVMTQDMFDAANHTFEQFDGDALTALMPKLALVR